MSNKQELARSYRFRAEELRTIAEMDHETDNRRILMDIANDYERMAATFDAIDQTNKALGKD